MTLLVSTLISIVLDGRNNLNLPSIGYIRTVGVKAYWDPSLQNQTTQILWGTVYTGESYNVTLYLQSTSTMPTTLQLTTANWTYTNINNTVAPPGPADTTQYMNLTWDYNNQTLDRNETIPITLTLTTADTPDFVTYLINNNIKQFSMDITIQANEV